MTQACQLKKMGIYYLTVLVDLILRSGRVVLASELSETVVTIVTR